MQIASSPPAVLPSAGAAALTELSGAATTGGPQEGLLSTLGAGETGAQEKPAIDDGSAAGLQFAQALAATLVVPAPQQPATPAAQSAPSAETGKAAAVKPPAAPFPLLQSTAFDGEGADAAPAAPNLPGSATEPAAPAASLSAAELAALAAAPKPKAAAPTTPQTPSKPGADTPAASAASASPPGPTTATVAAAAVAIQSEAPAADAPVQAQVVAANATATPVEPRPVVKTETKTAARGQDRNPSGVQAVSDTAARTPAAATVAASADPQAATDAIDADAGSAQAAVDGADAPDADAPRQADGSPLPLPVAATSAQAGQGAVRVDATTLPHLASQIIQKSGGKATRFDLELTPVGLGRVDVKVEISASGALTASFSFDNPQAAAELRGRSDELRNALTQAGFDLADNGLSFDLSGGHQRRTQDQQAQTPAFAGRAFAAADTAADDILANVTQAASRLDRRGTNGFDIRI